MKRDPAEVVAYRLRRASETLIEADQMAGIEHWNAAVNRLYYACFYAVSGLLHTKGLEFKRHSAARSLFGRHFVATGLVDRDAAEVYNRLFDRRQRGDYEDLFGFTREEVEPWLSQARRFVDLIASIAAPQEGPAEDRPP